MLWSGSIAESAAKAQKGTTSDASGGMNFLLMGYFYSDGDVATDSSLPLKDGKVTVHGAETGLGTTIKS